MRYKRREGKRNRMPTTGNAMNVRRLTAMLSAYARTGNITKARQVFDTMPERNVVSWNAMMTGYVRNGDTRSARALFDQMPESIRDAISWNSIMTAYCRVHSVDEARWLFDWMPLEKKNLVSWTVMISGYVGVCNFLEAWNLFVGMHRCSSGHLVLTLDQSIFVAAISAIVGLRDLLLLDNLRTWAIKTGLEGDVIVGTAILGAYSRLSSDFGMAAHFFELMPERNEFSWSTMISSSSQFGHIQDAISYYERTPEKSVASHSAMLSAYARHGMIHDARLLFDLIPDPKDVLLWNAMITGYTQNGMVDTAVELFERMPSLNSISWALMIAGFAQNGRSEEALRLLAKLHRTETFPSGHSCLTSALLASSNIGDLEAGRQVHSLVIKAGCQFNAYVGNGLITMYAKCSSNPDEVMQTFERMKVKDTVSWNSLIAGLSHKSMLFDAHAAFERMPVRDVVSWTSMISAYVQAGHDDDALLLFLEMLSKGMTPNSSTISTMVSVCANLGSTVLGKQLHCLAFKLGRESEVFVSNALITMYFKCGSMDSFSVFDEMLDHDTVTWNAMLTGCAHQGLGTEAIRLFEQMKKSEGACPNQVTFLTILCACSHAGLIQQAWDYFHSMNRDYGLMPLNNHYACMVDLLGRSGRLYEAEKFIDSMPIEPDNVVWGALLGACRIHQNANIGERVAERLFQMDPQHSGTYILLSNIYASAGMWDKVREVRKLMREHGVTKEPGCTWMHTKNKLHFFVTGENDYHEQEEIHALLFDLYAKLKATGYVPDTSFVLHDVEEEQKIDSLLYHSEKLAVACALLNTPGCTRIQIMKNLRICGDCHTFMKFLSMHSGREIDIRDRNRFHHFRDGKCSCGDYW